MGASLILDRSASAEEIDGVVAAFSRAGLPVDDAQAGYETKGVGDGAWLVLVFLGGTAIGSYLHGFFAEAGEEDLHRFREWLTDVQAARNPSGETGALAFQDDQGTNLVVASKLPDEAIEQLRELDWSQEMGHYLVWNRSQRQWRDAMRNARDRSQ